MLKAVTVTKQSGAGNVAEIAPVGADIERGPALKDGMRMNIRPDCARCWIRQHPRFREFTQPELQFVSDFKQGQIFTEAGEVLLEQGEKSDHLYTVLEGWGFRHKLLEDGRRQVLNYVLPGDLIGLQGSLSGEMQHSVEALTPMQLCVFDRARLPGLFENHAGLAFDLTWIAAQEERILDEHLLSIGRRSALERAAYLLAYLAHKGVESSVIDPDFVFLPLRQQHIADTLGLSIVHTNKTLRKLAQKNLIRWLERGCQVLDRQSLAKIAGWTPQDPVPRPFI